MRCKVAYLLIAYFLVNNCAKNYQNRFVYVRVIARQYSDIFGTQCRMAPHVQEFSKNLPFDAVVFRQNFTVHRWERMRH